MQSTDESPNFVTKKYRKLRKWLSNRSRKAETGAAEEDTNHKEKADQSSSPKSPPAKIQHRLARPPLRLPNELLAELVECMPHHQLGLTKLVTSYSSCPVGLFGVHLSPQNGAPSMRLFHVSTLLGFLLRQKRDKMVVPIKKWNDNELELYNKWKVENVHLITLLEEVKRLHASHDL